ncbi:MAG: EAL domain-containing protein [Spirochaetes bacterium]|nr:EAL domain-containing protein [Spirochaetota bacterium]
MFAKISILWLFLQTPLINMINVNINTEYILNTSKDFITLINRQYIYEFVNQTYCDAIEKKRDDIINKSVSEIWGKNKFQKIIKKYIDECFTGKEIHNIEEFEFGSLKKYMHIIYYPYFQEGVVTHVVVFSHDITKMKQMESKLIDYEFRDAMTGLFNRKSLEIVLDMELQKAKRSASENLRAVLFLSLRNLTKINQTFGYDIGDVILENTGMRIKNVVRESDYVFRFEGKELTIILTQFQNKLDILKVANKIQKSIAEPYHYKNSEIFISCNIGISIYPDDGLKKEIILKNATQALEEAKRTGAKYILFNSKIHQLAEKRLSLESEIRHALKSNQFFLLFQPIVNSKQKIVGCEALIRWNHPTRGLLTPGDFIPVAEESGYITAIGKWVLYHSCHQVEKWVKRYPIYVSVNISHQGFESSGLLKIIDVIIKKHQGINPQNLKLEITETDSMHHPEETIKRMTNLKNKGIGIFLDDFGTGQSSLSYLKRIPAETLKLDRSFITDIEHNQTDLKYVSSIISMVKSRGKKILVEGVANRKQAELLIKLGCDKLQGYYYSKPVSAKIFEEYLENGGVLPIN